MMFRYVPEDSPFAPNLQPSLSGGGGKQTVALGTASCQRAAAVSLEGVPRLEVGGGVTTAINFRIMPSDLLKT